MSGSRISRTESPLQSHSPFANLPLTSAPARRVVAVDREGLAIARIAAKKDRLAALTARVRERFGVELPQGPRRVEDNGLSFGGVGGEARPAGGAGWLCAAR